MKKIYIAVLAIVCACMASCNSSVEDANTNGTDSLVIDTTNVSVEVDTIAVADTTVCLD